MNIGHEGQRRRYYHERAKLEGQLGDPVRKDISAEARGRLVRELTRRNYYSYGRNTSGFAAEEIKREAERVLGGRFEAIETRALKLSLNEFLTFLEIGMNIVWLRFGDEDDILLLQSVLADDLSAYRIRNVGTEDDPDFQMQPIDNEHLHTEIVDRTFELTSNVAFESAQRDYAEAWKHYAKGDLDDAIVNAHKGVESAAKVIVKRLDPASTPEQKQLNQLIPELVRLDVLPSKLQNAATGLNLIFTGAGSLRNAPGTGHGSVDLQSPEATVALFALRMSGTLISFIAERWEQMKPKS